MNEIILGVGGFTGIILALVFIILASQALLVSSKDVKISINNERDVTVSAGGKLLTTLAGSQIFLPSAWLNAFLISSISSDAKLDL